MTAVSLFTVPPASPHAITSAVPYLAGHLRAHGHQVRIVDLNVEFARLFAPPSVLSRLTGPIVCADDIAELAHAEQELKWRGELALGNPAPTIDASWADVARRAATVPTQAVEALVASIVREQADHPGLIGMSCLAQDQLAVALQLARRVKVIDPAAVIIVGGPMLTTSSRYFLDTPPLDAFDYIVANNGAMAFAELLRSLEQPGAVVSKDIVSADRSEVHVQVKSIGLPMGRPEQPMFPRELIAGVLAPRPVVPVFSAQGCSYGQCNFCSSQRSVTPYRPTRMRWIVAEMDRLHVEHGVSDFDIVDNNFDPRRMASLVAALLERERRYRWKATARFYEEFDAAFLKRAVAAGCGLLCLGLESYDDKALAAMQKGYTTATVDKVLAAAHEVGLPIHLYAIVGHPSETENGRRSTLAYLRDQQRLYASAYLQVFDANLSAGVFVSEGSEYPAALVGSVDALLRELAGNLPACELHADEGGVLVRPPGYPRCEELFFLALADAVR